MKPIQKYLFIKRGVIAFILSAMLCPLYAQRTLSLDSCRSLAIRNNKQLRISQSRIEAAKYDHLAARTNSLPKVALDGGYIWNQKSTHLLSSSTRNELSTLGTSVGNKLEQLAPTIAQYFPELAPLLQGLQGPLENSINSVGSRIVDAFKTNTYNVFAGALVLTQPIYLGGRIKAYNNITNYKTELLGAQHEQLAEELIYNTDLVYWQIVSLAGKKKLAESNVAMLVKIDGDIQKMFKEGVVTKANTLTVRVKLNEAEIMLTKVTDGLNLAKMLLCQLCGIPINEPIALTDEGKTDIQVGTNILIPDTLQAYNNRKDLQALSQGILIADENVKLVKSSYMPTLAAVGTYSLTNPNVYNGFQNKFAGNFSVGLTLHVPIWNWNEGKYRIRSAKALAESQRQQYEEAKEKINLQLNQAKFKVDEAQKKLVMTQQNQQKADENLHYADVGFHEGVIAAADMLEAQTAWLQACSEKLDAEIDVRMTEIYLDKALGKLSNEY